MSLEIKIETLKSKHQEIEHAIKVEMTKPHPDDVGIHELKKQKLKIKDEIAHLTSH